MVRAIVIIMAILGSTFFVQAESVSLSGTVKKVGTSAAIAGVKVSLVKFKTLADTTGADGAFTITGVTTSIKAQIRETASLQFILKGNAIVFSPAFPNLTGSVDVFSSDGKRKVSIRFIDLPSGKQVVTLPEFGPGINIIRVSVGAESFTRTLMSIGNDLLLKNETPSVNATVN